MAADKYIALVSGRKTQVAGTQTSSGVANAGDIVALDDTGRIDPTLLPVGLGSDAVTLTAFENLAAGDYINVFLDTGTAKLRKADASTSGKEADGFVLSAATAGNTVTVYFEGSNTQLSGLTVGSRLYLSAATPGLATSTPPSASGNVVQYLGKAHSTTASSFEPDDGVILA